MDFIINVMSTGTYLFAIIVCCLGAFALLALFFTENSELLAPVLGGLGLIVVLGLIGVGYQSFASRDTTTSSLRTEAFASNQPITTDMSKLTAHTELMTTFSTQMIGAINQYNYDAVRYMIVPNSPLDEKQQRLLNSLYEQGITEELVHVEVVRLERVNDHTLYIDSREQINVHRPDGSVTFTDYTWRYTANVDGNHWLLQDIVEMSRNY